MFDWPNMSGERDSAPDTASPFSTEQTDQEAFSPEQLRSLLQAINDGSISLPASMPVTPLPAASSARAGRSRHYSAAGVNAPTASPALTPRRPPVSLLSLFPFLFIIFGTLGKRSKGRVTTKRHHQFLKLLNSNVEVCLSITVMVLMTS